MRQILILYNGSVQHEGRRLYALRKITIEPVFGQIKYNRHIQQFMRKRPGSSIIGMATGDRHPQSTQAPQPPAITHSHYPDDLLDIGASTGARASPTPAPDTPTAL